MKDKRIQTPRGNFIISAEFQNRAEAEHKGYGYYFTNTDGTQIFTKHNTMYSVEFGIVRGK